MVEDLVAHLPSIEYVIAVQSPEQTYESLITCGDGVAYHRPRVDSASIKLRLYTSGTTGTPEAALHSHNTIERVEQISFAGWQVSDDDGILIPSPVTHTTEYANGLGSGLVDYSQKMMVAARAMAEKKAVGQRS